MPPFGGLNLKMESNNSQKQACTQKISPLPQIGPETLKNKATGQHGSAPFTTCLLGQYQGEFENSTFLTKSHFQPKIPTQ